MKTDLLPVIENVSCCSDLPASLSTDAAEAKAARFKALADPTRVQLLHLVAGAGRDEACVCDLTDTVSLSQPTVSHHLRILVEAGLLTRERRGTWAWYRVADEGLQALRADLTF
ncbi:MAG: metalloregulator ArsR/SmtB family transcription factor [Aeromicrobium sp.]